jgi:hypothetical protein
MLVIFSSAHDAAARTIAAAWAPWDAVVCTPGDMSTRGWRYYVGAPQAGAAVIDGHSVPATAITGVLTRFPAVQPEMLAHIAAKERNYVAAEMTAFLIAFISALPCRMLNRPTAGGLCGPAWRLEQWIQAATRAGIPVLHRRRKVRLNAPAELEADVSKELTVIGDRVFGTAKDHPHLFDWARSLARTAGVGMLGLGFTQHATGFVLAGVNPSPDLDTPERLDAAREFLLPRAGGARK